MVKTTLENLSNELMLDIFEYFDFTAVLCSFSNLNERFEQLLLRKTRRCSLDLRKISKKHFDLLFNEQKERLIDGVRSLYLSENFETAGAIDELLRYFPDVCLWRNLEKLVIDQINSFEKLTRLIRQLKNIPDLREIRISLENENEFPESEYRSSINDIWSMKNLQVLFLNIQHPHANELTKMSVVSSSIRSLSLKSISYSLNDIRHILNMTEKLAHFEVTCFPNLFSDKFIDKQIFPSVKSFHLDFHGNFWALKYILSIFPNLTRLKIKIESFLFDGDDWQRVFKECCPRLERFEMKHRLELLSLENVEEQIDRLLDSFRSSFWINEKKIFFRCHWPKSSLVQRAFLYTLPYAFETFDYAYIDQFKSTADDHSQSQIEPHFYKQVRRFFQHSWEEFRTNQVFQDRLLIDHIEYLQINLDSSENQVLNLSFSSNFDNLRSLEVFIKDQSAFAQLKFLIDVANRLQSLTIHAQNDILIPTINSSTDSIRYLNIKSLYRFCERYLCSSECQALQSSSIFENCEVLSLSFYNQSQILPFIKHFKRLRSINFSCADAQLNSMEPSKNKIPFVDWLQSNINSSSKIVFEKRHHNPNSFQVWL